MSITQKKIWQRLQGEIYDTQHFTLSKKAKTKFKVTTLRDRHGRPKKWKLRLKVKYVYDYRPLWWLSQKKRYLAIEMLGIFAEKLRITYLLNEEKEKTEQAKNKEIKWQEVYNIQKQLSAHRRKLKHYRHHTNRELHSYTPHRVAKLFSVNRAVIYRILAKYSQTGDVLFFKDYGRQAGARDSIKTAESLVEIIPSDNADSRTLPLLKEQNSGKSCLRTGRFSLDPQAPASAPFIHSENDNADLYSDIWRFVTINRSPHQRIKENDRYWYKRSNRDLFDEHQEFSSQDYFRVTTDHSDIPGEAYVYKHSKSKKTKDKRYKSIEI